MSRQPQRGLLSLLRKAKRKLFAVGRSAATTVFGYPVLFNVNHADERSATRRALLIYLVEPFQIPPGDPRFRDHQNMQQCRQIAAALGEAGYVVDVVDVNDNKFVQAPCSNEYDLVLSHRVDLGPMGERLPKKTKKVYLATGMNHETFNRNMLTRYNRLRARRNCELAPPDVNPIHMPFVKAADAIVGFGNEFSSGTWKDATVAPVFPFNNYGFDTTASTSRDKDFSAARKNFLFFASRNQLGKGLDLLLEIFPRVPDLHLYVCSLFENELAFCKCYEQELFHTSNVHPVGTVRVDSESFVEIAGQCAFVILPSCSEGQPGSVVQAMHAGLIPVVTKECGIDVDEFGWQLENDSEETIEQLVRRVSQLDAEMLRSRAARTREIATTLYTEEAFQKRWSEIVAALQDHSIRESIH